MKTASRRAALAFLRTRWVLCFVVLLATIIVSAARATSWNATVAEEFNGSALDTTRWNTALLTSGNRWCSPSFNGTEGAWSDPSVSACQGQVVAAPYGSCTVAGGVASFSAGLVRAFPYLWAGLPSRPSMFPASGDYAVEIRFRYTGLGGGTGLDVLRWDDTTPAGSNAAVSYANDLFNVWGDPNNGVVATLVHQSFTIPNSSAWHVVRVECRGDSCTMAVDGVLRVGPVAAPVRPNALWLGNPLVSWWGVFDWSDFQLDYLRVLVPVEDAPVRFAEDFDAGGFTSPLWNLSLLTSGVRWCASQVDGHHSVSGDWHDPELGCGTVYHTGVDGGVVFDGTSLGLSGSTDMRTFPYAWIGPPYASLPIPPSGPFDCELRMKYDLIGPAGSGFACVAWPNTTPSGDNPPLPFDGHVFSIWADSERGNTKVSLLGLPPFFVPDAQLFHTYRLVCDDSTYRVLVDGVQRLGPAPCTIRPSAFWLGNPVISWWVQVPWDAFRIDYIRIMSPVPAAVGESRAVPARGAVEVRPNPVLFRTTFRFSTARDGRVSVEVHDIAGRRIRNLVDGHLESGMHEAAWDGRDAAGRRLPPGNYVCAVSLDDLQVASGRIVLLNSP